MVVMVPSVGFEPTTFRLGNGCAIHCATKAFLLLVGIERFELSTSRPPDERANQTAPYPDCPPVEADARVSGGTTWISRPLGVSVTVVPTPLIQGFPMMWFPKKQRSPTWTRTRIDRLTADCSAIELWRNEQKRRDSNPWSGDEPERHLSKMVR